MTARTFPTKRKGNFSKKGPKPESKILFQEYFKSVGPRTYASQVKELANGNHLLVLTEGKRDEKTGELRKCSLFIYSEDFPEFFKMVSNSAKFIKANPVSPEVKAKRDKIWAEKNSQPKGPAVTATISENAGA